MAGRRRGPTVEWKISLPQELALNFELLFYDPVNGKPNYGARAALVTQLLTSYWENLPPERKRQALTIHSRTLTP